MVRKLFVLLVLAGVFAGFVYLNNADLSAPPASGRATLLAHRGLAQTFDLDGVKADTCTATRIHRPEHPYLENTIVSMRAAFDAGADIVELDVHPTTDGSFAVFHDWTLDCRTDGTGNTRDHSLAELKALDIGHGYTADGGKTFPFRGQGIALMPSLDEVLAAFPDRRFLIHIKSNEPSDGEKIAARLAQLSPAQRERLMVYGGNRPLEALREAMARDRAGQASASNAGGRPLRTMSAASEKRCLAHYLAIGWSGHVPDACDNSVILVPANVAPWLWGWPHRLIERMRRAGSEVFILGPWDGDEFSRGVDTPDQFRTLPTHYAGGVWTNRIDLIAPLARGGVTRETVAAGATRSPR